VGAFVAGTVSIIGLVVISLFPSDIALWFGPAEFLAIGVCGLAFLVCRRDY